MFASSLLSAFLQIRSISVSVPYTFLKLENPHWQQEQQDNCQIAVVI